jgi:hypothetical protein
MIDDAATLAHNPMAKTTSALAQLLWVHGLIERGAPVGGGGSSCAMGSRAK